jgi:branched-chain amino acid transport system ATP-binding protein
MDWRLNSSAGLGGAVLPESVPSSEDQVGLAVRDAEAWYGQTQVLFGIDLHVGEHEIVGLFGHNGAGKSTLLRVLAGLHRRASYEAMLGGEALTRLTPEKRARAGLVFVREGANVFEGITVEEHLGLGERLARLGGRAPVEADDVYEHIPILDRFKKRLGSELSGGQRQLLALGMAFSANPRCLILDEPSTGLAPDALQAIFTVMTAFASQGVPVLVTEQNPTWLAQLVRRAYLLELGRIVAEGDPAELLLATGGDD